MTTQPNQSPAGTDPGSGASHAVMAAAAARTARQTAQAEIAHPGYVPLKAAALLIGRSTARTRQYVHDGKLGAKGEGWVRDEWGHILISEAVCASFVPPVRGNARAAGVKVSTHLRHAKATRKLLLERFQEGDARGTAIRVVNDLIGLLSAEAAEARADEAGADMQGGSGVVPRASTPSTQLGQDLAAAGRAERSARAAQTAPIEDAGDFSLDDIQDTPLGQ